MEANKMTKQIETKQNANDLYAKFSAALAEIPVMPQHWGDIEGRVQNELTKGGSVVATKEFTFNGVLLKVGDEFRPENLAQEFKVLKLARHNFCLPKAEWDLLQRRNRIFGFMNDKVIPLKSMLGLRQTDTSKARARLAAAEAAAQSAASVLRDMQSQERDAEAALLDLLVESESTIL
jgi:hypothetical protein